MDRGILCDFCYARPAVTSCEVCGANVCRLHKYSYGCAVCGGGRITFE